MQYPPIISGVPGLLHGGDYNPEQWLDQKDTIWKEDMAYAKAAHINTLSIGIFSWSMLEPSDGVYDFSWMDEVMDMLAANGIKAVLATPSGARPPWLAEKYPEVLRVNSRREHQLYGGRHNHCFTSPVYRDKVQEINRRLAQRYGHHPALGLWHISNEYGGDCHCPLCQQAFREFLKARYGSIDALNAAWWNTFWSHRYTSFDQIESPSPIGEDVSLGLSLNWRRFASAQTIDFYTQETLPLKELTPDIPCVTNLMSTHPSTDYFALGKVMDLASWDNYPRWNGTEGDVETGVDSAFRHDLMRGVGGQKPFLMMESSPSSVNWQPVNKLRRPGQLLLQSLQAIACGSDSVQYFQFRKSRGQTEQFHGAVIDHARRQDTRVFQELTQVGKALSQLSMVAGSAAESRAALIFDWENRWALEDAWLAKRADKGYEKTVVQHYAGLKAAGLDVDVIDQTADLTPYKLVALPMGYLLRKGFGKRLTDFVRNGGTAVLTYMTGYVDEECLCYLNGFPGELREVSGIWAEELDTLYPEDRNAIVWQNQKYEAFDQCEVIHCETAKSMGVYDSDFYAGTPALTENDFGAGHCYYIAARTGTELLTALYRHAAEQADLPRFPADVPYGVGTSTRVGQDETYRFLMNYTPNDAHVTLLGEYRQLYPGQGSISGAQVLPPWGVLVLAEKNEGTVGGSPLRP
ncbi:MAG: beta-galactosidase [Eubacteriales bacterium]|nr:beta-galactosidase [Eubacteriales bacterium]